MESKQTPKGKRTKQRIIDSSVKLIREMGIDKVTLNHICKASEIAQGTFYHYFKSLDEIFLEIIRMEGEELLSHNENLKGKNSLDRIASLLNILYSYYDGKGREIVSQLYRMEISPGKGISIVEEYLPIRPMIKEIVAEGIEKEEIASVDDPEQISIEIISLVTFGSFLWLRSSSDELFADVVGKRVNRYLKRLAENQ